MVCRCHPRILYRFTTGGSHRHSIPQQTFSLIRGYTNLNHGLPASADATGLLAFVEKVKRKEAKGLPIVHHHKYVSKLPLNHRFAMRKFHGVLRYLRTDGIISMNQVVEPERISPEAASLVHDPAYIQRFFTGQTSPQEQKITGFSWTECLVDRCRYETGGTLLAAQIALEQGLACSTGGGTHHAYPGYGSGYCLINDLAVAAAALIHSNVVQRVLIVDLDVHQGDGTALIFEEDNRVFTFSMHCQNNFPAKKQNSDLDIGLSVGTEDWEYMQLLEGHLPWIVDTFRPDLVLYDAGVDPHVKDELGKLRLTDQGLFDRDHYVLKFMVSRGIPCATVIGGGYSRNLDELSWRHTIVHRAATKVWKEHVSLPQKSAAALGSNSAIRESV